MKTLKTWAAAAAMLALTGAAQAALVDLGNGTVKDDITNLIWLQDWNVNSRQPWATQKTWAENLSFAGSNDWVLPSLSDYLTLFGEVGNLNAVSAFTNVQFIPYWSDTESATVASVATYFDTQFGGQSNTDKGFQLYAVAVRPGDAAAAVPEPQTLALALLALGATVVARRRRPA